MVTFELGDIGWMQRRLVGLGTRPQEFSRLGFRTPYCRMGEQVTLTTVLTALISKTGHGKPVDHHDTCPD